MVREHPRDSFPRPPTRRRRAGGAAHRNGSQIGRWRRPRAPAGLVSTSTNTPTSRWWCRPSRDSDHVSPLVFEVLCCTMKTPVWCLAVVRNRLRMVELPGKLGVRRQLWRELPRRGRSGGPAKISFGRDQVAAQARAPGIGSWSQRRGRWGMCMRVARALQHPWWRALRCGGACGPVVLLAPPTYGFSATCAHVVADQRGTA